MEYSWGIKKFAQAKSLNLRDTVQKFLEYKGIQSFTSKNVYRANQVVNENWNSFATFVDKGLKSGELKGNRVKLNTYYEELKERRQDIKSEFQSVVLTPEEKKVLDYITKDYGINDGKLSSFLAKKGLKRPAKDYESTSKKLQNLPSVKLALEHGFEVPL